MKPKLSPELVKKILGFLQTLTDQEVMDLEKHMTLEQKFFVMDHAEYLPLNPSGEENPAI